MKRFAREITWIATNFFLNEKQQQKARNNNLQKSLYIDIYTARFL